jgi:putative addiction module component (TIGR02574 family)
MPYNKEELLNLPVEEKLELIGMLWDHIDDEFLINELSQKEIEDELDRRIDELTKHPERKKSWEKVKAKMITRD